MPIAATRLLAALPDCAGRDASPPFFDRDAGYLSTLTRHADDILRALGRGRPDVGASASAP